jgi:2'-5' RNA ligase
MYSILSLIDSKNTKPIQDVITAIRPVFPTTTPIIWEYPHFTWHSAEEYDLGNLPRILEEIAKNLRPFTIRVIGMGLFTGKTRVLFLPILKTCDLANTQAHIVEKLYGCHKKPSEYYLPEKWIPHITLISNPKDLDSIMPSVKLLSDRTIDFTLKIDNISFGSLSGETARIYQKFPVGE